MAARQYLVGKYEEYYNSLKGEGAAASKANEYATEVNNLLNEFNNVQNLMNYWEGEAKDAMSENSLTSIMEKFKTAQSNVQEALEPCCQAIDALVGVLENMKTTEDEWLAKQDELEAKKKSEPTVKKDDSASQQRHNTWQNEVNALQTKIDELKRKLDEIKSDADTHIEKIENLESQIEEFTNYMNMTGTILGADDASGFSKYSLEERLQYLQELIDNYEKIYEGLNTLFLQKYSTGFKFTSKDFEKIDFLFDAFDIYWISKVERKSLVKSDEYGSVMLDIDNLTKIISFCTENDVFGKIDKYMNGASWKDSGLESLYGGFLDTGSANFFNLNAYNEGKFKERLRDKYGITGDPREYLKEHIGELTGAYKSLMDGYGEYEKLMASMSECQQYIDGFKQAKKLMPFEINMENGDFQPYLQKDYSGYSLLSQEQLQVMSQKEVALYDYLYHTKSKQEAEAYLKAMEQTMNQRIGAYRAAEYIEYIKQGGYGIDDLLKSGWEGTKDGVRNFFDGLVDVLRVSSTNKGDKSALDYEMMYKAQFMQELMNDPSYVDPNVDKATLGFGNITNWYNTGTSVGNMVIPSVVSFIPVVGKPLSTTLMTLSITGNTAVEAKQQGYSTSQAYLYGALSGASETFTEVMMGGIPGISNLEGKGLLGGMFSEGLEEFTQEYLDVGLRWATLGEKPEFTAAAAHERFANATQAGVQGMLTSGIMQGGNAAVGVGINTTTKALSPTVTTTDGSSVKKYNSYMEFKNDVESNFYTPRAESAINSALAKIQNGETVSFTERVKLNRAIQNVSTEELAGITHNLTPEQTQSLTDATRGIPKLSTNSASKITDARTLSRAMDSTTTLNGVENMTSEQLNSQVTRNGETMADYIVNRKAGAIDTTTIEKIRQIDPATADSMATRAEEIRRAAAPVQTTQTQTPAQPRTQQTQTQARTETTPVKTQTTQTQTQTRTETTPVQAQTAQTQTQRETMRQTPAQERTTTRTTATQTQTAPVQTQTQTQTQTMRHTPVQERTAARTETRTQQTQTQTRTETAQQTQVDTNAQLQQQAAAEQVLNDMIQSTSREQTQTASTTQNVQPSTITPSAVQTQTETRTGEVTSGPVGTQVTTETTQETKETGTAEKVAIAGTSAASLMAVTASGLSMMSSASTAATSSSASSGSTTSESSVANPSINASATQGIQAKTTTTTSSSSQGGESLAVSNNLTTTAIDHGLISSADTGASVPSIVNTAALTESTTTEEKVNAPAPPNGNWTYTLERNTNVGKRGETIEVKMDLIDRSLTPEGNLREARKAWNAAGRPSSGEIFDRYQSAFAYSKLAGGTNTSAINTLHQQEGNINYETSSFRSDATTEQGISKTDFKAYTEGRVTAEEINARRGQTTTETQTTTPVESTTTETQTTTPVESTTTETQTTTPVESTTTETQTKVEINTELITQVESEISSLSVEEVSELVSQSDYEEIREAAQEFLKSDSDQKTKLLTAFSQEAIRHGDVEVIDSIKSALSTEERTQLVESIRNVNPAMATAFETINAENASTFVQAESNAMTEQRLVEAITSRNATAISTNEEGQLVDEFGTPIESSTIEKHIENIESLDDESRSRYIEAISSNPSLLTNPPSNALLYADAHYQTITTTFGDTVIKTEDGSYTIGETTISEENMSRFVEIIESVEQGRAGVAMEMVSANPEIINSENVGLFQDSHFETLHDNLGTAMFSEQLAKTLSTSSVEDVIQILNNENMGPLLENGRLSTLLENGVDVLNEQFASNFTSHEMSILGEMIDSSNNATSDYSRYRIGEVINAQNNSLLHDTLRFSEIASSDTSNKSIYSGVSFTAEDVSRSSIYEVASVKDSAKKVMLMTEILGEEHLSVRTNSKGETVLTLDGAESVHEFIINRSGAYSFVESNPSLFDADFKSRYAALQAADIAIASFDGTNAIQVIENARSINYIDTVRSMTQEVYDRVTADYTTGLRTAYEGLEAPSRVVDGVTVLDVTDQEYSLLVHTIGGNDGVGSNAQISDALLRDLSKWSTTVGGNPNLSTSLITNTDQVIYGKPKVILGFANIEGHSLLGERAIDAGSSRDTLISPSTTVFDGSHTLSMEGLKQARAEYLAQASEHNNTPTWSEVILSRADASGKVLSPDYLVCFGEVDQFTIEAAKTLGTDGKPLPILVLNSTNPNATAINTDVSTMSAERIIANYNALLQNGADFTQVTPEVRSQILLDTEAPASLVLDLVSTTKEDTRVINVDGTSSSRVLSKVREAINANPNGKYVIEVANASDAQAFIRINSENVVMSYETSLGPKTMTLSEYNALRSAITTAQNTSSITPVEAVNQLNSLLSESGNIPPFMMKDAIATARNLGSYLREHSFTTQDMLSMNAEQLQIALTYGNNGNNAVRAIGLFKNNPEFRSRLIEAYVNGKLSSSSTYRSLMTNNLTGEEIIQNYTKITPLIEMNTDVRSRVLSASTITDEIVRDMVTEGTTLVLHPEYIRNAEVINNFLRQNPEVRYSVTVDQQSIGVLTNINAPVNCYIQTQNGRIQVSQQTISIVGNTYLRAITNLNNGGYTNISEAIQDLKQLRLNINSDFGRAIGMSDLVNTLRENVLTTASLDVDAISWDDFQSLLNLGALTDTRFKKAVINAMNEPGTSVINYLYTAIKTNPSISLDFDLQQELVPNLTARGIINIYSSVREAVLLSPMAMIKVLNAPMNLNVSSEIINDIITSKGNIIDASMMALGQNALDRIADLIRSNPNRTFTFKVNPKVISFASLSNVAFEYVDNNGVTKIATGAQLLASRQEAINFMNRYRSVNPKTMDTIDVLQLISSFTSLAEHGNGLNQVFVDEAANLLSTKLNDIDFKGDQYYELATFFESRDMTKFLEAVSNVNSITGINGVVRYMATHNNTIRANLQNALFRRGATFSDTLTSCLVKTTSASALIENYSTMSDATRKAITRDTTTIQSIVNNKGVVPTSTILSDILLNNGTLRANVDLDAIGAARVAQMINERGNVRINLASSPDNIRLIELIANDTVEFSTTGFDGNTHIYSPAQMRSIVRTFKSGQNGTITVGSLRASIDIIYDTYSNNFAGLTENSLRRLANPFGNIQLTEEIVAKLGTPTVEKMIQLGIQRDSLVSIALNSTDPRLTPIRESILKGDAHTLSETKVIREIGRGTRLITDTIAGVSAFDLRYTTAIDPKALTPQAISNINEFARNHPAQRIVLDFANSSGLSSDTIAALDKNVMVKIEGGYSTEKFTRDTSRNIYVDSEFASNIFTRNEAYAIIKTMERIESRINPSWSETEKAVFIYESLKRNITYDTRLCDYEDQLIDNHQLRKPSHYVTDSTRSLRGLVSGESVCAGYAVIYQEMLTRQGIEAYYDAGNVPASFNNPKDGGHAWNLVVLDGKKYICDLTWDRNSEAGKGRNQFVQRYQQFVDTHESDPSSTVPGYYYGDISTMNPQSLIAIAQNVGSATTRSTAFNAALNALSRNGSVLRTDAGVLTTTSKYKAVQPKSGPRSTSPNVNSDGGIRTINAVDPRSMINPQVANVVQTALTTPTPEVIHSFATTVRNNPVVGSYFADVIAHNPDVARRFFSTNNSGEVLSSLGTGQAIRVIDAAPTTIRNIDDNVIKNILNYEGNIPYRVMERILTDDIGRFTIPNGTSPKAISRIRNYVEISGREFTMDITSNESLNSWHILDSERVKGVFLDPVKGDVVIKASEFDAAITKYKGVFGKYALPASKGLGTNNLPGMIQDFVAVRKLGTSDVDNFIMRKIRTDMGAVLHNTSISTKDFNRMGLGDVYSTLYLAQHSGLSFDATRNLSISIEANPNLRAKVYEAITRGNFATSESVERALNVGIPVEEMIKNHTILNQRGTFSSPQVAERILNYNGYVPSEVVSKAIAYRGNVGLDITLNEIGKSRMQQFLATANGQFEVKLDGINSEAYRNFLSLNSNKLVGTYTSTDGTTHTITSSELRRVISEVELIGNSRNVIAAANRLYEIKQDYRFLGNDVFTRTVEKLNNVPLPIEQVQNMHPLTAKVLFGLGIQKDAIMSYALNNNNRLVGTVLSPNAWSIEENRLMHSLGGELTKGTVVGVDAGKISYTTRINPAILNDGAINTINEYARSHPDIRVALDFESTRGLTSEMISKLDKNILIKIEGAYSTEFLSGVEQSSAFKAANYTSNVFSQAEAYAIVKRFERIESRINPSWSPMEKAVYTYNVLAQSIEYDDVNLELEKNRIREINKYSFEADRTDSASHIIRSLRGVISGKTVCAGYAVIYQEALTRLGIETYYESGTGGSAYGGTGGHAWNIVTIDGKNYRCDLTWDYGGTISRPNIENKFIQTTEDYNSQHHKGFKTSVVPSRIYQEGFTSLSIREVNAIDSKVASAMKEKSGFIGSLESLMRRNPSLRSDVEFNPPMPNPNTRKIATKTNQVMFDNASRSEVETLLDTKSELSAEDVTRIVTDITKGNIDVPSTSTIEVERANIINQMLENGTIDRLNGGDFYKLLTIPETREALMLTDRGLSFYQKNAYTYGNGSVLTYEMYKDSSEFFSRLSSDDLKRTISRFNDWYTNPSVRDEVIKRGIAGDTEFKYDYKKGLNQIVKDLSGVDTVKGFNPNGKYLFVDYTTTNGETKTLEVKRYTSSFEMINGVENLYDAINSGQIESVIIREDSIKNTLLFNDLESGPVREFTVVVDGVESTILSTENDLNRYFSDVKSVEVRSVREVGDFDIKVQDQSIPVRLSYDIDGVHYEKYLMPTVYSGDAKVGVNYYISSHDLVGIQNVEVTEISPAEFRMASPTSYSIEHSDFMRDVLTDEAYGGHQGDVNTLFVSEYEGKTLTPLQQKQVALLHELSKKYFPNATEVEEVNLSVAYTNGGCYYMALANAFGSYMSSIPNGEEIFRSKFGFDLYTEGPNGKVLNLQAMVYDMYLDYCAEQFNGDATAATESNFGAGIAEYNYDRIVNDYYARHGIEIDMEFHNEFVRHRDSSVEGLRNLVASEMMNNEGSYFILTSTHFDMEQITDHTRLSSQINDGALSDSTMIGKVRQNVGGHAMLITEVDTDGNLFVSSWGNKHRIITSSIGERVNDPDAPSFNVTPVKFRIADSSVNTINNSTGSAVTDTAVAASPMNSTIYNALDDNYRQFTSYSEFKDSMVSNREIQRQINEETDGRLEAVLGSYMGNDPRAIGNYTMVNGFLREDTFVFDDHNNIVGINIYPSADSAKISLTPKEFKKRYGSATTAYQNTRIIVDFLNKQMEKCTLGEDMKLIRGVNWRALAKYGLSENSSAEEILRVFQEQGSYIERGFMSCCPLLDETELPSVLTTKPIKLVLNVKGTTGAIDLSTVGTTEAEILLDSGLSFKVYDVQKTDNGVYIYMNQD